LPQYALNSLPFLKVKHHPSSGLDDTKSLVLRLYSVKHKRDRILNFLKIHVF
jgi:hypothetical protein